MQTYFYVCLLDMCNHKPLYYISNIWGSYILLQVGIQFHGFVGGTAGPPSTL